MCYGTCIILCGSFVLISMFNAPFVLILALPLFIVLYPLLSKVQGYTRKGWPTWVPKPFHSKIVEVSVEDSCLLWGRTVIVPQLLEE